MSPLDWPDIPGVRFRPTLRLGGYAVGDDGSVWSMHRRDNTRPPGWYPVSIHRRSYGARYCMVSIRLDGGRGKVTCRYVHRLVLEAFLGPCPEGMQACHDDGDTANNRLLNLRWDTHRGNMADMIRHGTIRAKLTTQQVRDLRSRASAGEDIGSLAAEYGIGRAHAANIVARLSWRTVA